ncbi:V-set and immunoglobulin domain-containing protein 1-like [Astyanax mexicanus]|uniref:V-set and immunoglobulin domain-containing protein 1-like n=1 Tax=Astyanax mexicanus TaxID=7994 RepID=UPI0020CB5F32|nr:V-set and immunoglobulin domain-containing protein 1-like [Astyanax mexicanus]
MSPFKTIIILFSVIGCTVSIWVTVPRKVVNVTIGQTANLQCTFTTDVPMTNLLVQWNLYPKVSMNPEEVFYYQSGEQQIGKQFENRVKVLTAINATKNASISISNMQSADAGTYTCDVRNFPDISGQAEASVVVNVLEKPSYPVCAIHGDIATGHLVTLTCHSSKGSPAPSYTWSWIDQGVKRNALGYTNPSTGTLYIRNISQFEFGTYQCNASNAVGYSICTVELSSEMNTGAIVGAVIGALLAVLFIVLLVWFITHKMKKEKYAKANMAQNYAAVPPQQAAAQEMKDMQA